MKVTSIKELTSLEDGELIMRVEGEITKAYEVKSGEKDGKPWSVQNFFLKDDSGEIKAQAWNQKDVQPLTKKRVSITAHHGPKGYSGIYASDNTFKEKTTRLLKVTQTGIIQALDTDQKGDSAPTVSPSARSDEPGGIKPRGEGQNDSYEGFRHELMRCCNAFYIIEKAVDVESEQSTVNGFTSTNEHKQAKCATAFIHLDRLGLIKGLPDKPLWSREIPGKALNKIPPKKEMPKEEILNEVGDW